MDLACAAGFRALRSEPEGREWGGGCAEGINGGRHGRILLHRRRVMRLQPRVDHERAAAAPVLLVRERIDAMHVGRGV